MKKIFGLLFSARTTLVLLLIFATAIGCATFIEQTYDTVTANLLVYKSKWFELVILLLALNFIGNIRRFNLLRKEKLSILVFHVAFLIMILGAGVTRYIGFEGSMEIREGASSGTISSTEPYLQVLAMPGNDSLYFEKEMYFSPLLSGDFTEEIALGEKGKAVISYNNYLYNGIETVNPMAADGGKVLELVIASAGQREVIYLGEAGVKDLGRISLAFNHGGHNNNIHIISMGGGLRLLSGEPISRHEMGGAELVVAKDSLKAQDVEFVTGTIYETQGISLFLKNYYPSAKIEWKEGVNGESGLPTLLVNLDFDGSTRVVALPGGMSQAPLFQDVLLGDVKLKLGYGSKQIPLPFQIRLNDFILDRYAGSMSPSSYASEVTLIDPRHNLSQNHRIFMNNVLDYDGYRFFQSSYNQDELGTVLSVNHDFAGTWLSYLSYFLLALGFILTLLNRNSRFFHLNRKIAEVREFRKTGLISLLLLIGMTGFTQEAVQKPVSADHAARFSHLLVQSFEGRFQPIQTLAVDVVHKISRKDVYDAPGKGKMDQTQIFLDMILDPIYWKDQKIIYIREKGVADVIGIEGKYASFNDFIDNGQYKLSQYTEQAFRKKAGAQNVFDKEIIKVDERVNVFMMVLNGDLLKIFPSDAAHNNKWLNIEDTLSFMPLQPKVKELVSFMDLKEDNLSNILRFYLRSVFDATNSGDYSLADRSLESISRIQRETTEPGLLPSPAMVKYEIFYNHSDIFGFLRNWYGILSFFLLILAFIENFRKKKSRLVSVLMYVFIALLAVGFLYHSFGLGLRWYLSGHAPWSNGYEALILVAWAGVLAGFIFIRNSKITLAATALLAFSVLMTAGHSSYDPQLTNLQPVLKSYWLIIHVAVITISYGFLALGFVLGLINLVIYLFTTPRNFNRFNLVVKELTHINEMALIIGLFLATIGTFLGGIWANESWGRYWGWDAKETWALVIVITYSIILHFRMIPVLRGMVTFNVASILGFGSVLMTFIGVNYYLSKGLHSYAAGDTPVFPLWAWGLILAVVLLIVGASLKENWLAKKMDNPDGGFVEEDEIDATTEK